VSTLTRDQFIEYMEPTLHETFSAGFNAGRDWERVFVMEKSDKRREEVVEFTTPDVVIETPEGGPYARLQVKKVYNTSVVHAKFTGEVKISHEFIQDNFYRQIEKDIWGLGDAMARKLYRDACANIYNGFSSVKTGDNISLFGTHLLKYSTSTYSNAATAGLASDSLNVGLSNMMKTLDENGSVSPFGTGKVQLIVPPDLKRFATQLVMSPFEPDTANWAKNVFGGDGGKGGFDVEVVCLPLLAEAPSNAASQWYLRDAMRAENIFFSREEPKMEMVKDPYSPDVLFQVLLRYSFLIPTWRGLYGSTGAS
jgi:hypothetical protein